MAILNITKVCDEPERCWGVELLDDVGALLRSQNGVSGAEAMSIAGILRSEGPKAPLVEDSKVQPGEVAWVIEKARGGWAVRFTPVTVTSFQLLLKLDGGGEPPKAVAEAMALVKKCLDDVGDRLGSTYCHYDRPRAT